ncbi:glycoside hydrolase family 25 protein [Kocuria sp. WRN011]|uniref:glycoside hydrolase family 25 protein n=1 Tax=Kocuria sp. WRN011 TaxID=2029858 RepID=UPI00130431AD|nr:GH25 family lysozyme [Kocuria sp. WRN011]
MTYCKSQAQADAEQLEWLATAVGRSMPNEFGNQCSAAIQSNSVTLFGRPYQETLRYGNAIDHITNASTAYFHKIYNDPKNPNLLPRVGDIAVYRGAAPLWDGKYYGHTFVVDSRTSTQQTGVQQDGAAEPAKLWPPTYKYRYSVKPAHKATFWYIGDPAVGDVIGWLRPRWEKVVYTGADKRGYGGKTTPAEVAQKVTLPGNGIDVSNWQKGIDLSRVPADFVGVLATDGAGFTSPTFKEQINQAQKLGRRTLAYHYARVSQSDSDTQAKYFLKAAAKAIKAGAVPVLDWEEDAWNHRADWAIDWIRYVEKKTGSQVVVYQRQTAAAHTSWGSFRRPMWLSWYGSAARRSGYATDFSHIPPAPGWKVALWQYSDNTILPGYGGPLDVNRYFGGIPQWDQAVAAALTDDLEVFLMSQEKFNTYMDTYYRQRRGVAGSLAWGIGNNRDRGVNIEALVKGLVQSIFAFGAKRKGSGAGSVVTLAEVIAYDKDNWDDVRTRLEAIEKNLENK